MCLLLNGSVEDRTKDIQQLGEDKQDFKNGYVVQLLRKAVGREVGHLLRVVWMEHKSWVG
jgi:tetrahydromethanopterin S-methyltransferase subunit G